jgi:hypothetical protein
VCLLACLPGVGGFASANIYLPIRQIMPAFGSTNYNEICLRNL